MRLRTEELRKEYSEHTDGLPDLVVPLTEAKVLGILDTLGAEARRIDALVYPPTWGGPKLAELVAMRSAMDASEPSAGWDQVTYCRT